MEGPTTRPVDAEQPAGNEAPTSGAKRRHDHDTVS